MKKIYFLLMIVLLLMPFQSNVEAHSGRTDSNGGHNCSEKSKAKGLCTGYHYHNGGSGSSSGSNSSSDSSSKPGSSSSSDSGSTSGSSSSTDSGSTSGSSSSSDSSSTSGSSSSSDSSSTSKSTTSKPSGPSPEEIAANEKSEGEEDGHEAGVIDGYNGIKENDTVNTNSSAYQEGYSTGYQQGFKEGKKKLNSEKENAYKAGYEAAKEDLNEDVPANYSENNLVESSYKKGYKKATTEIEADKKEEYYTLGYEDGKKDVNNEPIDIKRTFLDSYNKGYKKGQQELEDKYINQGYEAAFIILKYEDPILENEKFVDWYKNGFDSNEEVEKAKNEAYELGLNGEAYELPNEYKKSEAIFSHYYETGINEYKEKQKESTQQTAGGLSIIALGWLARRFYVARKIIS